MSPVNANSGPAQDGILRLLVLDAICDDYENIDQVIRPRVAADCAKLAIPLDRTRLVETLSQLVADGLAKAYRLSPTSPVVEFSAMPPGDPDGRDNGTYFYITPAGHDFHNSAEDWPFDEEGASNFNH